MVYLRSYQRVAQKEHWCDCCCRHIQPGEMYEGHVEVQKPHGLVVFKYHVHPACEFPEDPDDEDTKPQHKNIEQLVVKNLESAA